MKALFFLQTFSLMPFYVSIKNRRSGFHPQKARVLIPRKTTSCSARWRHHLLAMLHASHHGCFASGERLCSEEGEQGQRTAGDEAGWFVFWCLGLVWNLDWIGFGLVWLLWLCVLYDGLWMYTIRVGHVGEYCIQ